MGIGYCKKKKLFDLDIDKAYAQLALFPGQIFSNRVKGEPVYCPLRGDLGFLVYTI